MSLRKSLLAVRCLSHTANRHREVLVNYVWDPRDSNQGLDQLMVDLELAIPEAWYPDESSGALRVLQEGLAAYVEVGPEEPKGAYRLSAHTFSSFSRE
jgi:hypothetical protein